MTHYPTRWRSSTVEKSLPEQSIADATDNMIKSSASAVTTTMVFEASTTVGLHIKRLTREHFGSGQQVTVVCTASSIGSSHQRSSVVKAVMDEGISSKQEKEQQQTGPLVNPLRPSAVPTPAAGDKRRSPQTSTGQSLIITRKATIHNSKTTTTQATSSPTVSSSPPCHQPAKQTLSKKRKTLPCVTMALYYKKKKKSIRHNKLLSHPYTNSGES